MRLAAAVFAVPLAFAAAPALAAPDDAAIAAAARVVQPQVVAWRRDIHQNPELGNRETRTAKLVADELKRLGMEVRTGVATTGVVGILRGGKPGKVVALRADMDGLPVREQTGLPFASTAMGEYDGKPVPVMHACGHDTHVAMLLGAARVLAGMKDQIPGTVMFIFQPAEEGAPAGETGGAEEMLKQGLFRTLKPDAVFGIHVTPGPSGQLMVRPGPFMAASDSFNIRIKGRQTHGARPWSGVDVISMTAELVQAYNVIAARQVDVTTSPTVLTVGSIQAGVRNNIIPEEALIKGTLRTFTPERRTQVLERLQTVTRNIAASYGAEVSFDFPPNYPVTHNDPDLTRRMLPSLTRAANGKIDGDVELRTGSEDFSFFQQQVPGVYYNLGTSKAGVDPLTAPTNHSPFFDVDEAALETGVRAHVMTTLDFLNGVSG